MLIGFRLTKTVQTDHLFHFLIHFLWNFAFKFLGSVHNWKQKYNQNTVEKAEMKRFWGLTRSRKYWKSCRVSSPEASSPRGSAKSYKQPDCWVLYKSNWTTSLSEFPLTILHTSFYPFPFLSKQPFHISREGKTHSFNTELMQQAPQWDPLLLAVAQMMYLQGRSSKQQQASAGALL